MIDRSVMFVLAMLCVAGAVRADEIRAVGSAIPLKGCEVRAIESGRVVFRGPRGRVEWRDVGEIATLAFDDFPALADAERALADGDDAAGFGHLLRSVRLAEAAGNEMYELWVRYRLIRFHDARGQFVPAAGHAAAIFCLQDDAAWRSAEPVSDPAGAAGASVAQIREAMANLERANRVVRSRELRTSINRLVRELRPRFDALSPAERAAGPDPETTLSGVPAAAIAVDRPIEPGPVDEAAKPAGASAAAPPPARRPRPGDLAPEAIDAWLSAQEYERALAACAYVAAHPDQRDEGRLLWQYGRALAGRQRPAEASVMFMRCAILHPGSASAAPSLVETALIYRDHWKRPERARALLARAIRLAEENQQTDVVRRAASLLETMSGEEDSR